MASQKPETEMMACLTSIADINLSHDAPSLPPNPIIFTGLTHLNLAYSNLADVPDSLLSLTKLLELDLSYNNLKMLPISMGNLENLTFLSVKSNQITELPPSIGQLTKLTKLDLSENKLWFLPEEIGCLQSCTDLDVSGNRITEISQKLCDLKSLRQLDFQNNWLDAIPQGLHSLSELTNLNLKNNRLRIIPKELQFRSCVDLEGNLITPGLQSQAEEGATHGLDIERIFLNEESGSFPVSSAGCRVFLQSGVQIYFPPRAVSSTTTITFKMLPADHPNVKLGLFDVLLSRPLELEPHGVMFKEEIEMDILCTSPCTLPNHEVMMRTFSDKEWLDIHTTSTSADFPKMWVSCKISHFSMFYVVSRLVEDRFEVTTEGKDFQSTVDKDIKITFPPGVTKETRVVRMQVLPIKADLVHNITKDPDAFTSPLLCLSQDTNEKFIGPITIKLPLPFPPEVKKHPSSGMMYKYVVLHGDPATNKWADITSQLKFEHKGPYVEFQVNHFSMYLVGFFYHFVIDMMYNLMTALRTCHVNFIVMQKNTDPEQVLVQCVPKKKVTSTLKDLKKSYDGPRHSDLVDLVEGEEFCAAFELGLKLHTAPPGSKDNKIYFKFHSHLDNIKEVFVKSSSDKMEDTVKGQVSFYREQQPEEYQCAGASTSAAASNKFLAALPIKVPNKFARTPGEVSPPPPLRLGSDETGYLNQKHLLYIAQEIVTIWKDVTIRLHLSAGERDSIILRESDEVQRSYQMLALWAGKTYGQKISVEDLKSALVASGKSNLRDYISEELAKGKVSRNMD